LFFRFGVAVKPTDLSVVFSTCPFLDFGLKVFRQPLDFQGNRTKNSIELPKVLSSLYE
jgi:hypothetical protein